MQTLVLSWDEEDDLSVAVAAPRVTHVGAPDVTWVEPDLSSEVQAALAARGHQVEPAREIGRVIALFCPDGILDDVENCEVVADKRGNGLALRVQ
jgi:gamma-glutamyltranspeptidase